MDRQIEQVDGQIDLIGGWIDRIIKDWIDKIINDWIDRLINH